MATTDVKVERIQNRRGLLINLPQPLRPGEYGLCTDTRQLFIGGDPEQINEAALQVYVGMYQVAQDLMDQQIVVANVNTPLTETDIDDLNTYFDANHPDSVDLAFYIPEMSALYVGAASADVPAMQIYLDSLVYVDPTSETNLNATVDLDGGVVFSYHSQSNAVGAILNGLSTEAVATTKLNIEVITEASQYTTPSDILLDPLEISLPNTPNFVSIPEMIYDVQESETLIIDYSVHYYDAADVADPDQTSYVASGTMKVTTNVHSQESSLVDESNVMTNVSWAPGDSVDFQALFVPGVDPLTGTVEIQYNHDLLTGPTREVLFKTSTRRWLSF